MFPGKHADKASLALHERVPAIDMWPLVLGDESDVTTLTEGFRFEDARPTDDVVEESAHLDIAVWLRQRRTSLGKVDRDSIVGE